MTRRRLRCALAGLMLAVLAGCGVVGGGDPVFQLGEVVLEAVPNANQDFATAVDLVFVYDAAAVTRLQSITAADWFSQRAQLERDFPDGLGVQRWEVVPGTTIGPWEVPEALLENAGGDTATAGFVFADYLSPGEHRARLETHSGLRIRLERDDFTLVPFPAGD
jgi:type VI secretion system protein